MNCPHCASTATKEQRKKTSLGYRTFRCSACRHIFNERDFHPIQLAGISHRYRPARRAVATSIQVEPARSGRDVLGAGLCVHATRQSGTGKPVLPDSVPINCVPSDVDKQADRGISMRPPSPSKGSGATPIESSIAMGIWLIPCQAEKRDMEAAKRFFQQAVAVVGHAPERVTTDGHDSYPRAIRETLGSQVTHRCNRYRNNRLEQDHRGIKQCSYPMRGFGNAASAAGSCRAFDEVRQFFRVRTTMKQQVSWPSNARCSATAWKL
jgi:putative transposase